jgi:hypothetical protein
MKITYHIPTEQYGFVEIEQEATPEIMNSYEDVKASVMPKTAPTSEIPSGVGLDDKEWRLALDGYMELHTLPSDVYERMSREQQRVMQELKKHYKRVNKE